MHKNITLLFRAALSGAILSLTACATTDAPSGTSLPATTPVSASSAALEASLPLVRTGAAVATGAVLDFAVKQTGTRSRLANEMYAAASAVYALSGGSFPTPAQFQANILAFGGTQADANYAQFSTAIAALYAAYYPKIVTGDTKTATDLLNAIAGGIEDATASYVEVSVATSAGTRRCPWRRCLPFEVAVDLRATGAEIDVNPGLACGHNRAPRPEVAGYRCA
jgi:hypothetical protein